MINVDKCYYIKTVNSSAKGCLAAVESLACVLALQALLVDTGMGTGRCGTKDFC